MRRIVLSGILCILTAWATQSPSLASLQERLERAAAVDPVDPLPLLIAEALAKDKNVSRAYLTQKNPDSERPVYVLTPIFEDEYPEEAISAAYNAFHQIAPEGKLELLLIPARDYKRYFARAQPIYVRP